MQNLHQSGLLRDERGNQIIAVAVEAILVQQWVP
jgi:hypothetical protein